MEKLEHQNADADGDYPTYGRNAHPPVVPLPPNELEIDLISCLI